MKSFKVFKSDESAEIVKAERVEVKSKTVKFFTGKKLVKTVKDFTVLIEVSPDIQESTPMFESDDE